FRDRAEVGLDLAGRNHAEVVLLATGEDRVRELVVLRRGEDELHPGRGLFERLQERVEGPRRQHVDLVDGPDLEAVARGGVARALAQLAHLLYAVVRGAVDLLDVEGGRGRDLAARRAFPAGVGSGPFTAGAVEGLGQDPRGRRLAHAARPGEEEGVADPAR